MYLTLISPLIPHMNTLLTGYTGSEMGLSEAEVDARHAAALASQTAAPKGPATCCTEHAFRGSEMGLSEASIDALHQEAASIRIQNIAKVQVNGICDLCPNKAERQRVAQLYSRDADIGNDR